ncbi:MAG: bacteriohemerythrin [Gammaproteobacteria bacterium]|nr:bacteriohemerythrin [Gammaproteobacteria bacterium]
MSLIEWRDDFELGIADVDHEHRQLIDLINELHTALAENNSSEQLQDFLGEVYARMAAHFALEERVMRELDYDEYVQHKDDHEQLLDGLRDIMDKYEDEQEYSDAEMASHLNSWFGNHFKSMDARFHQFLEKQGE